MKIITATLTVILLFNLGFVQSLGAQSLNQLYNSRVEGAQRFLRPFDITAPQFIKDALPKHCGVVVSLANGQLLLIQKGNEYGKESGTTIANSNLKIMSSAWSPREFKIIRESTVGDYVKAGGPNYNLVSDNSMYACDRMMQLF